jgi:hypothetical protein
VNWATTVTSLLGGAGGGALWNYVFETSVRPRRQARDLARSLAVEIIGNGVALALAIELLDEGHPMREITALPKSVFTAVAAQIGLLPHDAAKTVVALYGVVDDMNESYRRRRLIDEAEIRDADGTAAFRHHLFVAFRSTEKALDALRPIARQTLTIGPPKLTPL